MSHEARRVLFKSALSRSDGLKDGALLTAVLKDSDQGWSISGIELEEAPILDDGVVVSAPYLQDGSANVTEQVHATNLSVRRTRGISCETSLNDARADGPVSSKILWFRQLHALVRRLLRTSELADPECPHDVPRLCKQGRGSGPDLNDFVGDPDDHTAVFLHEEALEGKGEHSLEEVSNVTLVTGITGSE
jgi:hypothetical protein